MLFFFFFFSRTVLLYVVIFPEYHLFLTFRHFILVKKNVFTVWAKTEHSFDCVITGKVQMVL